MHIDCDRCRKVRELREQAAELERSLEAEAAAHAAQLGRAIKRDTDVINGLLREIDALYLLLQKQRDHGGEDGGHGEDYIRNCQDMPG